MNIDVDAYFGCELLNEHSLTALQAIIAERAPGWATRLRVYDARNMGLSLDLADTLTLYKAVQAEVTAPPNAFYQDLKRRFGKPSDPRISGSVELRGATKSLTIIIHVDEKRFSVGPGIARWGNKLAFQIRGKRVDGVAVETFACDLFREVCARLEPWYARANTIEEFSAKNISREGGGVCAIGVDWSKAIPGLYWLNYFAGPAIGVIGKDRFLSCPAVSCEPLGQGYVVALADDPASWDSDEYRARERQIKEALGERFFYNRQEPDRPTESPYLKVR